MHIATMADDLVVLESPSAVAAMRLAAQIRSAVGPAARVDSSGGVTTMPFNLFLQFHNQAKDAFKLSDDLKLLVSDAQSKSETHSAARLDFYNSIENGDVSNVTNKWLDVLLPHQALGVSALLTPGLIGACVFDEQGTGKTLMAIATIHTKVAKGEITRVLVVGPKTLLDANWMSEVAQFWPDPAPSMIRIHGSGEQRFRQYQDHALFYFISYDSAYRDLTSIMALARGAKTALVVDESFFVKNPESMRGKALELLASAVDFRVVLCGTPAPNRPADVIQQMNIADNGFTFGSWSETKKQDATGSQIDSALSQRGVFLRRLKSDVLSGLPEKQVKVNHYALTSHQAILYHEARTNLVLELSRLDQSTFSRQLASYFQKRAALLQICVSPNLVGDPIVESGKYNALMMRVHEILSTNDSRKALIWSAYTKSTDHLMQILKEYSPVRLDGTVAGQDRKAAVDNFRRKPQHRLLIGNPAAAGAGLNLIEASFSFYVSHSNQAAPFMQSLDRIHRIGQKADAVTYEFFAGHGTIEALEIKRLLEKQESQAELLRDSEAPLNLAEILAELQEPRD